MAFTISLAALAPLPHLFDGHNAAEMELLVLLVEISSCIMLAQLNFHIKVTKMMYYLLYLIIIGPMEGMGGVVGA